MRLEYKDVLHIGYYDYGEAFTGSLGLLRYRIAIEPEKSRRKMTEEERQNCRLRLFTWQGEKAFNRTEKELIQIQDYDYSEEGLRRIVDDINEKLNLSKNA